MMLCDDIDCTGCMSCVNICSHKALSIIADSEGFERPVVNKDLCTDCGACTNACPILNPVELGDYNQKFYASWTKDEKLRLESSSGGLFTELAKKILSQGGIVFGASFDDRFNVYHTYVETEEELSILRGSKYVQSSILHSFKDVKRFLKDGRYVLFSGTPCQIAGLRKYLIRSYDNLYTIDIICHGVPSPRVFNDYKEYVRNKIGSPLKSMKFRDKKYSWIFYNISINNDEYIGTYYSDPFIRGFLRDYFLRPSCHNCRFTTLSRQGDITIADYWGYRGVNKNDKNFKELGVSLAIINSEKGDRLFNLSKSELVFYNKNQNDALKTNASLTRSFPAPHLRMEFWKDYSALPFETIVNKWMKPERIPVYRYIDSRFKHTIGIKGIIFITKSAWRAKHLLLKTLHIR